MPVSRKFGIVICFDPPDHVYNFMLLKIQHGGQLPSGKYEKHLDLFQQNFSVLHICFPQPKCYKKYCTDNKTANINDKNCSLSIALTAMDQKLQKS